MLCLYNVFRRVILRGSNRLISHTLYFFLQIFHTLSIVLNLRQYLLVN